jgi:hypothetical protein
MLNLQEPCRVVIKESEIVDNADEICKGRYVKWIEGELSGVVSEANKSLPTKIPYEFMDDTVDHIFKGGVKNAGTVDASASGWHYIGSDIPEGNKIIQVTRDADKFGTIEAEVEVGGIAKDGISTFFSNKYTPNEVVDMIMQAHRNKSFVPGSKGRYIGVADNGMTIEMYLYRNAEKCNISDIITAYPVHVDTLN